MLNNIKLVPNVINILQQPKFNDFHDLSLSEPTNRDENQRPQHHCPHDLTWCHDLMWYAKEIDKIDKYEHHFQQIWEEILFAKTRSNMMLAPYRVLYKYVIEELVVFRVCQVLDQLH